MADFSNFELGENVMDLAGGLIPEMAEVFEVTLSPNPTQEELGKLVGAIGQSKVLQENIGNVQEKLGTDGDGLTIAANWLGRSGVQLALSRSLWTPHRDTPWNSFRIIATGAVANWQDRTTNLLVSRALLDDIVDGRVDLPTGNRVMNSPTEIANDNIQALTTAYGKPPTEAEYAREIVLPELEWVGYDVQIMEFDTTNGQEIAERFLSLNPSVLDHRILFARVANAGVQLACQFRIAARQIKPSFDREKGDPQVFVGTDSFPIARTPEEAKNPSKFQNPFTGIRQIAVTAKEINSLAA